MRELTLLSEMTKPGTLWLVGGFLRDALLKRPLADADLAVKGDPKKLARALASKVKGTSFPLDEDRGVYRVVAGDRTIDLAALQGATIEKDLARRDFTVNALALPLETYLKSGLSSGILDLFGGLKDLKARRLKEVSRTAFKEDPLRILRGVRFSAELGFSLSPATLALFKTHAKGLKAVSPERVREELMKTLATPGGAAAFRLLDKARVLSLLLPEAEEMRRTGHDYYGKEGVLGHSLDAMASFERLFENLETLFPAFHKPLREHLMSPVSGYPRYALLKLGELLHDVGKPATAGKGVDGRLHFYGHEHVGGKVAARFGKQWRLSGDEAKSLTRLVSGHMRPGNLGNVPVLTDKAIYRFYRDMGEDSVGLLVMALGDHFTYVSERVQKSRKDPVYLAIRRMLDTYFSRRATVEPPKLLDGHAVMKLLKVKPGPRVGEILEALREAQAAGKVKNKEEAVKWVARLK